MLQRGFWIAVLLALPTHVLFAQQTIQSFGTDLVVFLSGTVIPFLLAIAFVAFVYNIIRYFIVGAGNANAREDARRYALYSIAGFVLIVSIWGIVNLLVLGLGFDDNQPVCPDFIPATMCG